MSSSVGSDAFSTVLNALSAGPLLSSCISALGVASLWLVVGWTYRRTGSAHVVVARLWRIAFGKREVGGDLIDSYLGERDALMHFRMMTGLKRAGTAASARRVIRWLHHHDVDVDRVSAAGKHFDIDALALKQGLPGWGAQALCWVALIALLGVVLLATTAGITAPALLRIVRTGTWYAVDRSATYRFELWSKAPAFAVELCSDQAKLGRDTGYPASDIDTLCDVLQDNQAALGSASRGQRFAALVIVVYATAISWLLWRFRAQATAAVELRSWLEQQGKRPPRQ